MYHVYGKRVRLHTGLCIFLLAPCTAVIAQGATEIVRKADEKMRGETLQAEMIIRTVRPTWTREMVVKAWTKGNTFSMILIQAPKKDEGTAFLKRGKEVWNWMPTLERAIKLPPSMMAQSWMGTDFSNDDLVKESSVLNDYTHQLLSDTAIGERLCHKILLIPKPDAAVVWGKIIVCIDKQDYMELHTRFYDEDGVLMNTMTGFDIKIMDGRLLPSRFEMVPADKPSHKTELIYKMLLYNQPIDTDFFTLERMKTLH
jgi:outer membrane lipoprotein-sorting protein